MTIQMYDLSVMCKKLNIIFYTTMEKNRRINIIWNNIYSEILFNKIEINNFNDLDTYLLNKYNIVENKYKFNYMFIRTEINNYSILSSYFYNNIKLIINKLNEYILKFNISDYNELKIYLDKELNIFKFSRKNTFINYKNINIIHNKRPSSIYTEELLILFRYVCDILFNDNELHLLKFKLE